MTSFKEQEILMLSYYFPPIKSVAVLRGYYLHLELKKYFSAVHVLTTSNRKRLQQEPLPLQADSLLIVPTLDYRTITNLGKKRRTHFSEEKKKGWVRWLLNVNNSFPFNLLIGEGGLVYILCGFFQAVRLVRQRQLSHVYSSFMPYSDHVIAWLLTLFFPKKITWIADFRDLHVDPIYRHVILEKFQHRVWRTLLSRASLVTTVSEGLAKHLRHYHPKVHVMRNGIGHLNFTPQKPLPKAEKFTIAYTGSMYKDERDPSIFLEALRQLLAQGLIPESRLQLRYAGKDSATWCFFTKKYSLEHLLLDEGLVSFENSATIQQNAQINLLLTSSHPELAGVVTGKFCEYLAAGRPILLLINGTQDAEFEDIFEKIKAGIVVYTHEDSIPIVRQFLIEKFCEWQKAGIVARQISSEALAPFMWKNLVKKLMDALPENEQEQHNLTAAKSVTNG
jgi:hypothetical protein